MKFEDIEYSEEKIVPLYKFPIIKANLTSLKKDFESMYGKAFDHIEEDQVPLSHLEGLKSDLFCAFCHGAKAALYINSSTRQNFNLPEETMKEMNKSKIIMPNDNFDQPKKDLIL